MITDGGRKAAKIREYFYETGCRVMGLQETKHENDAALTRYLTDGQKLGCWGSPGTRAVRGKKRVMTAGVALMWDAASGVRCITREVVEPGRIIRSEMEAPGGGRFGVVVAYMYGAGGTGAVGGVQVAKECWDKLAGAVNGGGRLVVLADMNATVKEKTWAGERFREMCKNEHLAVQGKGEATHAKGREIDHVLVGAGMTGEVGGVRVDDVSDIVRKDHRAVSARWRYGEAEEEGDVRRRRTVPGIAGLSEEWWAKAAARMAEKARGGSTEREDAEPMQRLEMEAVACYKRW